MKQREHIEGETTIGEDHSAPGHVEHDDTSTRMLVCSDTLPQSKSQAGPWNCSKTEESKQP